MTRRAKLARAVWVIVGIKLVLQLATTGRYGWFIDELYYLACADHLAWSYVDHPPLSIAITWLWREIGGGGLVCTRVPAAISGALTFLGTAAIARELGGRAWAQAIAALATLFAGVNLVVHGYASMNGYDTTLWVAAFWLTLRLAAGASRPRWWMLGVVLGLGLLNKWSVAWLGAGLAVGWVATAERRLLTTPGPWVAAAIAAAIAAPQFVWQLQNDWPTLEFIHNATTFKMLPVGPVELFAVQVLANNPVAAPLWLLGLFVLLRDGDTPGARALGICFLVVTAILIANGTSRPNYLAIAQPPLVAAGAVLFERARDRGSWQSAGITAWTVLLCVAGVAQLPLTLPLLPPADLVRYQTAIGIKAPAMEHRERAALDGHFSDRFGWPELIDTVARVHAGLPAHERAGAIVFTGSYADAGAIDHLGRARGLPPAYSGHNHYWHWGPPEREPTAVIVIGGEREALEAHYGSVEAAAVTSCEWCAPRFDGRTVWVARELRRPLAELWPELRHYD
jgi:4-amino-4-deoxy-L-arabinose transferase-like glycosyltransferase